MPAARREDCIALASRTARTTALCENAGACAGAFDVELDVEIAAERVLAAREAKLKKAKLSTAEVATKRTVLIQKIARLTDQLCIASKKWNASREKAFSAVLEARTTVELHNTYEVARATFFRRRWERFRKAILPLLALRRIQY